MNKGLLLLLSGYILWGGFPVFWSYLSHVTAGEVLAHRIFFSVPVLIAMVLLRDKWKQGFISAINSRRELLNLLISGTIIAVNWGVYILAVNYGRIIEASMGYFISPLIQIIGGYLIFNERLSKYKKTAVLLATASVFYYILNGDVFPWIGLIVGFSFASYGIARKIIKTTDVPGLLVETTILLPLALAIYAWLISTNQLAFLSVDIKTDVLIIFAGLVTVVPLALFTAGAKILPMTTTGILFFTTPLLQFMIGYTMFDETINQQQLVAFIGIWLSLIIYSVALIKKI
ncbi:MAG TPA: EamA family transporter RarD [Candidatus Thioglobus sp.]|jgi:chloramphenicol-sensitive protein RarD|nr:EamA family transporter RarD [Candidatus Thioglobus sp.]HIL42934.1 EamA family transporter RarD [Gammaproteobacteria bacterium]